jgi:hypothetical protein
MKKGMFLIQTKSLGEKPIKLNVGLFEDKTLDF